MPRYHRPACLGAKPDATKARDERRGSSAARGYDRWWAKTSQAFRRRRPLCCCCYANGIIAPSQVTDHIIPHKGDDALLRDPDNWQALCHRCHNTIKKALEALFEAGKITAAELRMDRPMPDHFDTSALGTPGGG